MKKILLVIGFIAVLLIAGFFVLNQYIYDQKQAQQPEDVTPYRGTLSGEYVCLPSPDERTAQASECVYALRTDQDEYFVTDFNLMSQEKPDLEPGNHFTASGLITPIENLSTDHWQKYPVQIEGIFSITDSIKID